MYIIVGLGNPGKKYENTRHNIGFITIDHLAEKYDIRVDRLKFKSLIGEGRIGREKVLLVKPQTYMNLSGEAVREVAAYYKVDMEKIIVIYDDLDLEAGTLRIRKFGSAGTHNGMKSVVYQLKSDRFPRIRIGIGMEDRGDIIDFVIGGFTKKEKEVLEPAIDRAVYAIEAIVSGDVDLAMNRYNTKKKKAKKDKVDQEQGYESQIDKTQQNQAKEDANE